MKRWLFQLGFGLLLGMAARIALPGHHPGSLATAALLSVVGAAGGGAIAEWALPADLLRQGGFVLAGMGSITALLVQAMVVG